MLKLYMRIDGVLHYHEAWTNGDQVVEHWGIVGERGRSRSSRIEPGTDTDSLLAATLQDAVLRGFQPIELDDHKILMVEYPVSEAASKSAIAKRHRLEDRLNETLGWTGLGLCDGGSIGSGTMEVCCFVVDFEIAKRVIENDIADTEFSDYGRIFDAAQDSEL